jgi:hypothetical protein
MNEEAFKQKSGFIKDKVATGEITVEEGNRQIDALRRGPGAPAPAGDGDKGEWEDVPGVPGAKRRSTGGAPAPAGVNPKDVEPTVDGEPSKKAKTKPRLPTFQERMDEGDNELKKRYEEGARDNPRRRSFLTLPRTY